MEDYKEKYESALKVASKWHKDGIKDIQSVIECIFPELKKSEDERIKKEIIQFLQLSHPQFVGKRNQEKWIAWLEKQDQKKHEEELENAYKCADEVQYRRGYEDAKRELKKQGEKVDVIKNFNTEFERQISHLIASTINKEHKYNKGFVKLAANSLLNYAKRELEKQGEQKPTWSEEDENMLQKAISTIMYALSIPIGKENEPCFVGSSTIYWLKSLKERMKGE